MRHTADPAFWQRYRRLPRELQRQADRAFQLLKRDPRHPSLHLKRVKPELWSARVGLHYRALATDFPDSLYWFWIGPQDEYDRLLG